MKKLLCIVLALVLALGCNAFAMTNEEAAKIASSVTETTTDKSLIYSPFIGVIESVQGSVVGVNNYQTVTTYSSSGSYYNPFSGYYGWGNGSGSSEKKSTEKLAGTGSGTVVYEHIVLTNYHVTEDASRLSVSVNGEEEEYEATLISYDEGIDVAVLYVPELEIVPVQLGDSDQMQVGEFIFCIGNPLMEELYGTVTSGIVSAIDRQIESTSTTDKYGLKTNITNTMIQIDAAINNGNSGGGMFNTLGQLMGIPSLKYSGTTSSGAVVEGIGMCIPINSAKPFINEAIVKVLTGNVGSADDISGADTKGNDSEDKPMLGITGMAVSASNYYLVYTGMLPAGVMIDEVTEGSPAEKSGMGRYDIIVDVEGKIVTSVTDIREILDKCSYGDTVKIKIYRLEGLPEAVDANDTSLLGEGSYIDLEVELFRFGNDA